MHIGTLRTALWDYFLARKNGGKFIIRIEDTDQDRFVEGAFESLLGTLKKFGIDYDEGPVIALDGTVVEHGDCGPYIQSQRLDIYRRYADELVAKGVAYRCFCTQEQLDEMRSAQSAAKQTPKYDRRCLKLGAQEVARRAQSGEPHVIRMKIPEGTSEFIDAIRGHISFNNADVDDQIIIKSNGFASYHLAVVVDDHLMNISHVLRGEEWISSTPKQIILHGMLGWSMPVYAHVPLLLNPDKTKLSKRKGDVAVESYLAKGYLPQTLLNFIATLGYNPTADREIYTLEELIHAFDLAKVNKSGAVLNVDKLDWMNQQYISRLSEDEMLAAAKPFVDDIDENEIVQRAVLVERARVSRLDELPAHVAPYRAEPAYDPSILIWKKSDKNDAMAQLAAVHAWLAAASDDVFGDVPLIEAKLKEYIASESLQNGNVLWPLRVALSGLEKSSSPFELLWALGKSEALARIDRARAFLA